MKRISLITICAAVFTLSLVPFTHGQKATEQFIPIGKSPGVSAKNSIIGEIDQYDEAGRTITVSTPSGKHTIKMTDQTKIYLDRTKLNQGGIKGSTADLQKGRRVEVKYKDPENKANADWIKVEIT